MDIKSKQILNRAYRVKALLQVGAMTYDDAVNSPEIKEYREMVESVGKEVAKKHGKKFYKFNVSKFLR